jgi:hypothetical protein
MADYHDFDALTDPAAFRPAPPPPPWLTPAMTRPMPPVQKFADGSEPEAIEVSGDAADAMADATPTSGKDDAFTAEQKALVEKFKHEQGLAEGKQADIEKAQAAQQKELAPKYAELSNLMNRPKPGHPQYGKAPPPPENPFIKGGGMEYMGIMSVFAGLAGALGRSNATATMAAFGGAMKGYAEGNEQVFQQQAEEWKMANQKMLEDNQAKMDAYKEILEDQRMDVTQKSNEIKLIAAKTGDEITYNMQNMNAHEKFGQAYEHMFQVNEQMKDRAEKMAMAVEDHRVKMENAQAAKDEDLRPLVRRDLSGMGVKAYGNISRDKPTIKAIQRLKAEEQQKMGLSDEDIMANYQAWNAQQTELNTVGRRAGNVGIAIKAFEDAATLAEQANSKSYRSGVAAWNDVLGQYYVQTGDKAYRDLVNKTNTAINIYARIVGGGGAPHVEDQKQGHILLNPGMPPDAYKAGLNALRQEGEIEARAPGKAREEIRSRPIGGGGGGDPKIGDRKQFKQGVGIWNGTTYVPETQ